MPNPFMVLAIRRALPVVGVEEILRGLLSERVQWNDRSERAKLEIAVLRQAIATLAVPSEPKPAAQPVKALPGKARTPRAPKPPDFESEAAVRVEEGRRDA